MKKRLLVAVIAIAAIVGVGATAMHMEQSASEQQMAQPGRGWSQLKLIKTRKTFDIKKTSGLYYIENKILA